MSKPVLVRQREFIPLDDSVCENPVFILGVHRSGTSLLRRILDSHSKIACPPETFYLRHFCEIHKDSATRVGLGGFGVGKDNEEYRRQIAVWAARYHEAYRLGCKKERWADKTPHYVGIAHELADLFGPGAQFVLVFRHPFDIVFSIYKRGWKLGAYHEDAFMRTVLYVKESLSKLADFVDLRLADIFVMHYEKLTELPNEEIPRLFSFLNLPWEEGVLSFNQFQHNFGTEDPVVRGSNKIFKGNKDKWRSFDENKIEILRQHLGGVMKRTGYSVVDP